MRKSKALFTVSALLISASSLSFAEPLNEDQSIKELVRFLVAKKMLSTNDQARAIPLSFYVGTTEDIAAYFGDYLCTRDNSCTVVDTIYSNPFAILGRGLPPMDGTEMEWLEAQDQIERTNLKYATDIYHAATWQIALALAAKNGFLEQDRAKMLVANQLNYMTEPQNRAFGNNFIYGAFLPILVPELAYSFRWLATSFYNKDPFFKGRFQRFIRTDFTDASASKADPRHLPPSFYSFVITWSDQKPLTGKNAWAQLIGPLQAEYLFNSRISARSPALINAMNSLTAFSLMQSGIGAFYFAPLGTEGGQAPISPSDIAIEDNFALLAGLQLFKNILENTEQTAEVKLALTRINVMLNGGTTLNGFKTLGLLSFIYNGAFDTENKIFYTHGSAPIPRSTNNWRPNFSDIGRFNAVSTNLWALSALGVETIDRWFGTGTALAIWQNVRNNGGYFNNGQLWGMGYSLNNNIGSQPEAIMTTAGTAAAINALNSLIDFYGDSSQGAGLQDDLAAMKLHINNLRNDLYLDANFTDATPREFFILVPPKMGQAYLYASKRLAVPLDWNANTLASSNANAWVMMNNFNFNPFQFKGKLAGENYPVPAKANILDTEVELPGGALPKTVTVRFDAGDLGAIKQLVLRYNLDGSQSNWLIAAIVDLREGFATLPQGTKAIAISFVNNDVANACEIVPANEICIDNDCLNVKSISAHWSSNGRGSCGLSP